MEEQLEHRTRPMFTLKTPTSSETWPPTTKAEDPTEGQSIPGTADWTSTTLSLKTTRQRTFQDMVRREEPFHQTEAQAL